MGSRFLRLAVLCLALLPVAVPAADTDESPFALGAAAFARSDYALALRYFEAARSAGADGPSVPYNIAVCRFKLGQYSEAEREFALLGASFPSVAALAAYNRALALLELGRDDEARAELAAARADGDAPLAALAAQRLAELAPPEAAAPARAAWTGLFDASVGHDDNVALVDELALPAGQSGDSALLELLGFASRAAGAGLPLRLDLTGYAVRYPDSGEYDQSSLGVGAAFERRVGGWRVEAGPHYSRSTLGGEDFEAELGVGARVQRTLGERARFTAALSYDDVNALDSTFAFLEGSQWRLGVAMQPRDRGLRASFDLETNDRARVGASPDRQRWLLGYRWPVRGWRLDGAVSYRVSRYDGAAAVRERLTELRVGASRELARGWRFAADYRRSNNDADLPAYSYTGNRFAATLGKTF